MKCHELARTVSDIHPDLDDCEVAQLCLLVYRATEDRSCLTEREAVGQIARAASFRLEAAADQHAAMSSELATLFTDGPVRFSPDQIWTLLRAIKVQSQLLELYAGAPAHA